MIHEAGIFIGGITAGVLLSTAIAWTIKSESPNAVVRTIHQERLYDGKDCLISRLNIRDSTGLTQLIIVETSESYPKCRVIPQ